MPNRRLLIRLFRSLPPGGRHRADLSWVTPGLSISGTLHPRHLEWLFQLGIGAIVDLREEGKDDGELLGRYGIRLLYLPVRDHWPPSQAQLVAGTQWIADQRAEGRKALIHCKEGIGRSVVLACCTLMMDGLHANQALSLVKSKRWGVALNTRQLESVREFEQQIWGRSPGPSENAHRAPESV